MQLKNHKALDIRDQSSKILTPHTYTKENMERKETTWERENERQPPKNQRLNLRPEITFQTHISYTNENIIQISSGKHGERESHQRCDESCKEMQNREGKGDRAKSENYGAVLELWKRA